MSSLGIAKAEFCFSETLLSGYIPAYVGEKGVKNFLIDKDHFSFKWWPSKEPPTFPDVKKMKSNSRELQRSELYMQQKGKKIKRKNDGFSREEEEGKS